MKYPEIFWEIYVLKKLTEPLQSSLNWNAGKFFEMEFLREADS